MLIFTGIYRRLRYEIIHLNFSYLTKITSRYTSLQISNDSLGLTLEATENEKHKKKNKFA